MPLQKIREDHPIYRRAVHREGVFWTGQGNDQAAPTHMPTALLGYRREREVGVANKDRFAYLRTLGPFRKGLSIGCGGADVERVMLARGIVKEFTFVDISEKSLQFLSSSLSPSMRKRTRIERQDLNFINLPAATYDFIFCANVLHHVVNLEHVLLELNKALTPDGILYIDDFIGEDRFQFSDARIAAINRVGKEAHERTGVEWQRMERTSRSSLINSCPFEAVRSADLGPLLHRIFGKQTVFERTHGAISGWMSTVIPFQQRNHKALDRAAEIFVRADRTTRLPPLFLFGAYRKNPRPPRIVVRPWTKREIAHHLPVRLIDERYALRAGMTVQRLFGGKIYATLKRTYFRLRGA